MVFHWSLSDSKSSQVSRTLLSILSDLRKAVVWMVSVCPLISETSSPFTNHLGIVPCAPTPTGITVTFIFHSFFSSPSRSLFIPLFTFFQFYSVFYRDGEVHYSTGSLFLLLSLGLVVWVRFGDPSVFQNPREICASLERIVDCANTSCWFSQI